MICSGVRVVPDYFARQLERELNAAKAEQYALARNFTDVQTRLAIASNERDEARECLREVIKEAESVPDLCLEATISARWRKAAGM
jgi:sugar-specific transcriptional regulator TrmB